MTMQTFEIEVHEGFYGEYCSLVFEDGIESVRIEFDQPALVGVLEKLKTLASETSSSEVLADVGAHVSYAFLNAEGEEIAPQFHRENHIRLSSRGYCEIKTVSRYVVEDFWRLDFEVNYGYLTFLEKNYEH